MEEVAAAVGAVEGGEGKGKGVVGEEVDRDGVVVRVRRRSKVVFGL